MKKLGLIGGTGPESTLIYYREIEYGVQKKLGGAYFPRLTIESMSVFDVLRFCNKKDYEGLTAYLLDGLNSLHAAGVDIAAFTGITPHIVYTAVAEKSPIPVVSMVETACRYAKENAYMKIGLLGTLPTMQGSFFQDTFSKQGITVVTPHTDEMRYIGEKIETELEYGIVKHDTCKMLASIVNRMVSQEGIQAVVLGCTELPLAFSKMEMQYPVIDVMQIHIEALVNLLTED